MISSPFANDALLFFKQLSRGKSECQSSRVKC